MSIQRLDQLNAVNGNARAQVVGTSATRDNIDGEN